ncbi:MAG: TIGR04282 family arsenosugar biosynthesis glycosyltransferase [Cytophagales bacterium]|nr:TIGR04282 family arsenosugar biosynthesis glycosyltransferase [Armatimonadota bacterium]
MTETQLLIVAVKVPLPGNVKTRLIGGAIGEEEAALLATSFLQDTLQTIRLLPTSARIQTAVALDGPATSLPHEVTLKGFQAFPQIGNHLGERLVQFFEYGFQTGARSVCVIGTDAPHLPGGFILEAFGRLARHPQLVVLGPADDGGYFLIGASGKTPHTLLEGIPWSTGDVLAETLRRAVATETSVSLLPSWYDVDTSPDLARLARDLRRGVVSAPQTQKTLRKLGFE